MKFNQFEPNISSLDIRSVNDYMNSGGWLTENNLTRNLEGLISTYTNRKYSIAVPNGTQAIYLALLSLGINKDSLVAVPNLTMIATINAILWTGAKPYIIDTDKNLCMDLEKLKEVKNLDAVIYVPLNGRTRNGLEIAKWCKENNIKLLEDSAHALGSEYNNSLKCGKLGDVSIFSFTPHKIITMGQGGMVLTDNRKIYENIFKLKTFNRRKNKSDWHNGYGLNFKITDLQASLGITQFQQLTKFIKIKKKNFAVYDKKIKNKNVILSQFFNYETPWFYDVYLKNKNERWRFYNFLMKNDIEARYHYPCLSKQKFLNEVNRTNLEISEKIDDKLIWLPSSTKLNTQDIVAISTIINSYE